ncbi:unnamed protein product, partial [Brenthis ino]
MCYTVLNGGLKQKKQICAVPATRFKTCFKHQCLIERWVNKTSTLAPYIHYNDVMAPYLSKEQRVGVCLALLYAIEEKKRKKKKNMDEAMVKGEINP